MYWYAITGISLLFYAGLTVRPHEAINISAPIDPAYWTKPSGAPIEREQLMVVLTNIQGLYIRASYGPDPSGSARLSKVALDSAREVPGDRALTDQDKTDQVTR